MLEAAALPFAEARSEDPAKRLAELFDAHHQRLYRLARRLSASADDARDLVQDAFVRAAQKPGSIPREPAQEEAWLVRVLVNLCRDRWRQHANRARLDARMLPRPSAAGSDEARFIAHNTVWRALDKLSVRRRAVIVMFELEGLPVAAIGETLGMSPVTVRWHLSRGRKELAGIISEGQP